ncbi:hypothetical protein TNIN_85821 [Trichonephila inaurata madagascariensis]|uniref:Uncharacterized protein n=1 Tax=Trichonephila inaurata madagascariensis TaxID=2747483 RepID=A0A8X6YCD9_9ARAC|nr:hypothetical protein TNIN_85821 [Trichonephila inaurata madagascariensis]
MFLSSNHSPIFLGLNMVSTTMGWVSSIGWMLYRLDRCCECSGIAKGTACEIHSRNAFFLASVWEGVRLDMNLALERRYRAISVHSSHPTPFEPI